MPKEFFDIDELEGEKRENAIIARDKSLRKDMMAATSDLWDRKTKAQDYAVGNQWDSYVQRRMLNRRKFCLTIPLIKPTINQAAGVQVQNPRDIQVKAEKDGSEFSADIVTSLVKHAEEKGKARFKKSQCYKSGLTTAESSIALFVDKSQGLGGRIRIVKTDDFEVIWDPTASNYDVNDPETGAMAVIWEPWVRKDVVEKAYPDKVDKLRSSSNRGFFEPVMGAVNSIVTRMTGRRRRDNFTRFGGFQTNLHGMQNRYKYQISHTFTKLRKECIRWIDIKRGPVEGKVLRKDDEIKAARKQTKLHPKTFEIEEIVCDVMHHTIRRGDVFLEEIIDENDGLEMFSLIPFVPHYDNGYKSGDAEDMVGTQDEINWAHSMKLNLIKNLANTGWKIVRDVTGAFSDWLKAHGTEDGIVINETDGGGKVEKIKPNEFPASLDLVEERAKENLKLITNIRTEDPTADSDLSGRAIALKQQGSLVGSAPKLSNWDMSMAMYAELLVGMVVRTGAYTIDEIKAIIDEDKILRSAIMDKARGIVKQKLTASGFELPEQPTQPLVDENMQGNLRQSAIDLFKQEVKVFERISAIVDSIAEPIADRLLIEEIESIANSEYSTTIVTSPYTQTHRLAQSATAFELNKALIEGNQLPLSRETLIESTDLDGKDEEIEKGKALQSQLAGQAGGGG